MKGKLANFIVLARPHQYPKNALVFFPLFFGGKITDAALFFRTLHAFVTFCLLASAVYVFNDYIDAEADRRHPEKRHRPLAAGKVGRDEAFLLMAGFAGLGMLSASASGRHLAGIGLAYLVLNLLYTLKLKHISIIDVFSIAAFFMMRLFAGSVVTGIELSLWIIIMTFLLALFIAFAKRRDDLMLYLRGGEKMRRSLEGYNIELLNAAMMIVSAVIIVCYIMDTISPEVTHRVGTDKVYLTAIFVILGILRYMQIVFVEEKAGAPTMLLLSDRFLQLTIAGWLLVFGALLYW